MASESITDQLHVVMFPWFAFGHISPFVQLSNKLSLRGVKVSFFSASGNIPRIKSTLKLSPMVEIIPLSIPRLEGLPPGIDSTSEMTDSMAELLKQALDIMKPQIKSILSELKPHFVFFDFVQHWMPEICLQLGVKTLLFSVFSAIAGSYLMVPARGTNSTIDDLKKLPKGLTVSSDITLQEFQARNLLYVFKRFYGNPSVFERELEALKGCTAIVIKTCNEMEGIYVEYRRKEFQKLVLLTGPLVNLEPLSGALEERWANWLGQFPAKSVIFGSFGSETFPSNDQIKELALGLELTGLPFFLVLNFPANLDTQNQLDRALPEGFLDRVKNRGIVHTGWVQQQLILAHESVGCYISHAGFSSVMEAIVEDCQLVLLPIKGDQFLNSKLVAKDMKAGVEVNRREEDGHFVKEDICDAVKTVTVDVEREPGISIRENQKKWREFLLNEEIQNKFITDLVKGMKALV